MKDLRLIVNGDDFGISKQANEAIIRAFRKGTLTSCSLMVAGEAFEEAVSLMREHPGMSVGIHLVTVMGRSVLPHARIPELVDENGRFPNDPTLAGIRYFFSRAARRQLEEELRAQFEKFLSTGFQPSHIDSHLHMHVNPVIFRLAVELGERYGVKRMRVPDDDYALAGRFVASWSPGRAAQARIFRILTRRMRAGLKRHGFSSVDRVYGHFLSGRMSEEYVLAVLERLQESTGEIYFHPAYHPDFGHSTPAEAQGMKEYEILAGDGMLERVRAAGIRLISYHELESKS